MSYRDIAHALDGEGRVVEAAWAYELAIQDPIVDREVFLDLAALYFICNDTGFFAANRLHRSFVYSTCPRAMEILALLESRYGRSAEVDAWRQHMRERVLGELIPAEVYERLASEGSAVAHVLLYVASGRTMHRAEAERVFAAVRQGATARQRYLHSLA